MTLSRHWGLAAGSAHRARQPGRRTIAATWRLRTTIWRVITNAHARCLYGEHGKGTATAPHIAIAKSLGRMRASVKVKAHCLNLSLAQKPRRKLKAAFGAPISPQGIRLNETAHKVDRADASRGTNAHWGDAWTTKRNEIRRGCRLERECGSDQSLWPLWHITSAGCRSIGPIDAAWWNRAHLWL